MTAPMLVSNKRRRAAPAQLWLIMLLSLCLLMLSACSNQQVYSDLTEQHANEMVAVLSEAGISATKSKSGDDKWGVAVSQGEFSKAVDVLRANGLPKEQFESLGTVFKKTGMSSSPAEERARWNFGKSQELGQTITNMEGVVSARVHLAVPEPDPLSREAKPSAASVYLKYRTGYDMRSKQGAIKSLLSNSIEGLDYDRVSVFMEPAQSLPVAKTNQEMVPWGTVIRIVLGIIAIMLIAVAGRAYWRTRKARSTSVVQAKL